MYKLLKMLSLCAFNHIIYYFASAEHEKKHYLLHRGSLFGWWWGCLCRCPCAHVVHLILKRLSGLHELRTIRKR